MNYAQHAAATGRRPLRPPLRARRVRRGHGRAARQPCRRTRCRAGDHGAREPRAPRRRRRRPATGDGAGILMQMPDELLRAVVDFELPPRRPLRRADVLPADRRGRARERCEALLERDRRGRGPARCSAGATCRSTPSTPARSRGACRPVIRQLFVGAGAAQRGDQDAFERKLYVIRRVCELSRGARGPVRRLELLAHDQLQGHADQLPAGRLLPRPARRARQERARARALALLDQHVPELGARAPLPRDLPQRRDQHGDGQRQLDARPRERAAPASCSARTCAKILPVVSPATRTRRRSTTCSSC